MAPLSLLNLPSEILHEICTKLCHHCTYRRHSSFIRWPGGNDFRNSRSHLLDVSRVCRQLRAVAQPVLFHCFRFQARALSQPILRDVLAQFLRTLDERRELRCQVKYIDIDARDTSCTCCLPYIQDWPSQEELRTVNNMCSENAIALRPDSLWADEIMETHMQVLLTILPNITEIRLTYPRAWKFELLENWRYEGSDVTRSLRPFLPNVRRMLLEVDKIDQDGCVPGHGQCEQLCPESPVEDILIHAAPNLKLLACTASGLSAPPFLPHLTHLQIMMRGTWASKIVRLLSQTTQLTHFSYWSVNEHCPPPKEVVGALLQLHGTTLQYLSLAFSRPINDLPWTESELWAPPNCHDFVLESLSEFTHLRYLSLDDNMIWEGPGGRPIGSYRGLIPQRNLVSFLPAAIETLFIEDTFGVTPPLQSLAEAMASGLLENLQLVVWAEENLPFCIMDRRNCNNEQWLDDDNWREELEAEQSCCIKRSQKMMFPILTEFETRYPSPPPDTPSRVPSPVPLEKALRDFEDVSMDAEVAAEVNQEWQVDVNAI